MKKFVKFLNGFLIIICLFGVFYLLINSASINIKYDFPTFFIPVISFLFLFYFGYKFMFYYFSADKIEYEFTAIVNHTFRTPLTRIMWTSRELQKSSVNGEQLLYLQNLDNGVNKLLEIVDLIAGIQDIKNTTGYIFIATSFRDIIEKSITKYREEINKKNITFNVSTFSDIPLLTVDLKKITFVIDAVVENAVTYTPTGGKIMIDCMVKSHKILFYVADSGMGLTIIDEIRVFSRFFRSKRAILAYPDGMGLRLYLSKQIIERHNGKIYAKSKGKNKGSVFFVELPISK